MNEDLFKKKRNQYHVDVDVTCMTHEERPKQTIFPLTAVETNTMMKIPLFVTVMKKRKGAGRQHFKN